MARFSLILLALVALIGCQDQVASTDYLPPPTFDTPQLPAKPAPAVAFVPPIAPAPAQSIVHITPRIQTIAPAADDAIPADWIPTAAPRPWRWIVIHHSATSFGNAAIIDGWHRAKGWDELGYHFVIGNGTSSGDGQIEVGPRWPIQKWGAHTKTADNRYNDFGIGICLVGNFDIDYPSDAQLKSVTKLVAWLMKTYNITPDGVIGHGDAKPTDCPGKNLDVAWIRRTATQLVADAGENPDSNTLAATDKGNDASPAR